MSVSVSTTTSTTTSKPTSPPSSSSTSSNTGNSSSSSRVTALVPPPVRPFSQFGNATAKLLTDHYTFDQQKFRIIATAKGRIPYTVEYGVITTPTTGILAGTPKSSQSLSAFSLNGYLFGAYAGPQLSYQYIGYTNPNTGDSTYIDYKRPFGIGGLTFKATAKSLDANYNYQSYSGSAGLDYIRDRFHIGTNFVTDGSIHNLEASASVKARTGLSIGGNVLVKAVSPVNQTFSSPSFSLSRYNVGFEQEYGNWLISAYSSPSFTPSLTSANTLLETNFNKLNVGLTKVVTDRHTISALGEVVVKDPTGNATIPSRSLTVGSTYKLSPSSLVKGKVHVPSGVVSLALENRFVAPKLTFGLAFQTDPLNSRLTAWGLNAAFGEY